MKLELSWQIFEKYDVKFHKNPSSGSRAVPCGQTVLTKPTVASRNFAKAFKKTNTYVRYIYNRETCYTTQSCRCWTARSCMTLPMFR